MTPFDANRLVNRILGEVGTKVALPPGALVFLDDVETRLFVFGPHNVHVLVLKAILDSGLILHFHVAAFMARNLVNGFFIHPNKVSPL